MRTKYPFPSALSGVLYAEDFGEAMPPSVVVTEPETILPSFSLDELRAATEQARAEGREAERLASAQSQAVLRNAGLAALAEQIRLAHDQSAEQLAHGLDALARTLLAMLSAALPALCRLHAATELRALLQQVLPPTRQLAELRIRLHPSLRAVIEQETACLLEGSGTQVAWTESESMPPGDIAIVWQNGAALRDTDATCATIRNAVVALFATGAALHEEHQHVQ